MAHCPIVCDNRWLLQSAAFLAAVATSEKATACLTAAHARGMMWKDVSRTATLGSKSIKSARAAPLARPIRGRSGYALLLTEAVWPCDGYVRRPCAPRLAGTDASIALALLTPREERVIRMRFGI